MPPGVKVWVEYITTKGSRVWKLVRVREQDLDAGRQSRGLSAEEYGELWKRGPRTGRRWAEGARGGEMGSIKDWLEEGAGACKRSEGGSACNLRSISPLFVSVLSGPCISLG